MTKHAVVLAAGKSQLPYIREFKRRGWRVTAVDRTENACGFSEADTAIQESVYDREQLENKLSRIHQHTPITTVFSNSSAAPVAKNIAYLNQKFDTTFKSFSTVCADICYNKHLLLEVLSQASINIATPLQCGEISENDLPIVVKPFRDSLGGAGVHIIETMQALKEFTAKEKPDDWRIEQFIGGKEFSVDGIVCANQLEVISISEKFTQPVASGVIPTRFSLIAKPEENTSDFYHAIYESASQCAKALDITNSQISLDIKVDENNRVTVIECGLFWDSKVDRLWLYSGLDPYAYFIDRLYYGRAAKTSLFKHATAMDFLYAEETKAFDPKDIAEQFKNDHIEYERSANDIVKPPSSVADILACRFYKSA